MRYFLDTEFHEKQGSIELISIGIVSEDGRKLYAESSDYNWANASDWLIENVIPHLWSQNVKPEHNAFIRDGGKGGLLSLKDIAREVRIFCDPDQYGKPEFWGYYADYDWVVFCWLFGAMIDLPKGFPMYCRDLKQLMDEKGAHRSPVPKPDCSHHALIDAEWVFKSWAAICGEHTPEVSG